MERYAFFYRSEKVQALSAQSYSDPDDLFIREPFYASFQASSFDFTLITIHSIYGDSKAERRAEALLLDDVYQFVQEADPNEQDVILLGDFNLPPEDEGFDELEVLLTPLFTGDRYTTIRESAESLYDNIWFESVYLQEYSGENGIDDFDVTVFENDDDAASLAVSDHRPIWAKFLTDGDTDGSSLPSDRSGDGKIGFDDFFLFADQFGTQLGDENWDPTYDFDSSGRVDFDDFFIFADYFGRSDGVSTIEPSDGEITGDFTSDASDPVSQTDLINVNTASLEELETLPGVGPTIGQRIIDGRPYESVDDLLGVDGIGEKRLEDIRPLVTVE
ncbi:hypothetical protein HN911_00100 [Candidatus Bathyarchaeota archaeon]|jgi:competence ComEA-like helix-hairpin-helix protein|nr:hypothetical protein [Candidatus Bathyarchaeota archaeon]